LQRAKRTYTNFAERPRVAQCCANLKFQTLGVLAYGLRIYPMYRMSYAHVLTFLDRPIVLIRNNKTISLTINVVLDQSVKSNGVLARRHAANEKTSKAYIQAQLTVA